MTAKQVSGAAPVKWQTELLRFTAFFPVGSEPRSDLWFSFTGTQPEQATDRPAQGMREEFGTVDDTFFVVRRNPGRIDFLAARHVQSMIGTPYDIGEFEDALLKFAPLVKHWFEQERSVTRLAFGAVLSRPAGTMADACNLITVLVPSVKISEENYSDLLFQINRPRMSHTLPDMRLNRLMKWQAVESPIVIVVTPSSPPTQPTTGSPLVQLEVDINTPLERTELIPPEVAPKLFFEMVEAAQEIANKGDS